MLPLTILLKFNAFSLLSKHLYINFCVAYSVLNVKRTNIKKFSNFLTIIKSDICTE